MEHVNVIIKVNADNAPKKIIKAVNYMLKVDGQARRKRVYISSDGVEYLGTALATYLGLAPHTLSNRENQCGIDSDMFLSGKIAHKDRKHRAGKVYCNPTAAWKNLGNKVRNSNLSKLALRSGDSIVKCPPAATGSYDSNGVVGIFKPIKDLGISAGLEKLSTCHAGMERRGILVPSGHYNSYSGKMI